MLLGCARLVQKFVKEYVSRTKFARWRMCTTSWVTISHSPAKTRGVSEYPTSAVVPLSSRICSAAYRAAKDFVNFCRGRAWVFSDLGADAQDQALRQVSQDLAQERFVRTAEVNAARPVPFIEEPSSHVYHRCPDGCVAET